MSPRWAVRSARYAAACAVAVRAQRLRGQGLAAAAPTWGVGAHPLGEQAPHTADVLEGLDYKSGRPAAREVAGPHSGPYGRGAVGSAARTTGPAVG